MAKWGTDERGAIDDTVWLTLGGKDVEIAENYSVRLGVFHQPASWTLTMGWSDVAWDLLTSHQPGEEFKIRIGGVLQQTGKLDAVTVRSGVGGTFITLAGRDALAPLYDAEVEFELSFNDETYSGLVRRALEAAGIKSPKIALSNVANRPIRAGVKVVETQPSVVVDEIKSTGVSGELVGVVKRVQSTQVGERWLAFVRRILDRAGLFLWAAADGSFIVTAPHHAQRPTYRIVRRADSAIDRRGNVTSATFKNDTTSRHSEVVVYGRSGKVRTKAKGSFVDDEMTAWGLTKRGVIRDTNVQSPAQAAFLARRKIAEERRAGWELSYVLAGHTTAALEQPGARAVWTPDTTVMVDDYVLGLIHKVYYVESVEFSRSPETTTTIRLQRPEDLVFGEVGK